MAEASEQSPVDEKSPSSASSAPKFAAKSDCAQVLSGVSLEKKVIFITGTTSGIGVETAKSLARAGAHLILANRNIVLSETQKKEILEENPHALVDLINLDLSSLQSVQAAAKQFIDMNLPLHILILNAGVFSPPEKLTVDSFERAFGVNHLAHFYLIRELLPVLRHSAPSRIVIVSSSSHRHTGLKPALTTEAKLAKICPASDSNEYGYKLYAYSKMCNVLTALKLHRDEHEKGVSVYVLHPGACIPTNIGRTYGLGGRLFFKVAALFTKTLSQGAATTVLCAARPELQESSGHYWQDCGEADAVLDPVAKDEQLQNALYDRSEELIKKFEQSRPK